MSADNDGQNRTVARRRAAAVADDDCQQVRGTLSCMTQFPVGSDDRESVRTAPPTVPLPVLSSSVIEAIAVANGVCVHPVPLRRIDTVTGVVEIIDVPCGATLASKCEPCANRSRLLRMVQCRQGWHLDTEPIDAKVSSEQSALMIMRADLERARIAVLASGGDPAPIDNAILEVEAQLAAENVRGRVVREASSRRVRSTRRRQDVPDLPRRKMAPRTIGRTFEGHSGKVFRPSVFLTLTCRSYGPVRADGTPVDPSRYDYRTAARDAIHFPKLIDRFWKNLRRVVGFKVQYFATLEPQKRLAPHLHAALRGTVSRADLRLVAAATYQQVWWPACDEPLYEDASPVWDNVCGGYVDPLTGEQLPTWDEALDRLAGHAKPAHVVRFGAQVHAQGVLGDSPAADRCIGYLVKYLNKDVSTCHELETTSQADHLDRGVGGSPVRAMLPHVP